MSVTRPVRGVVIRKILTRKYHIQFRATLDVDLAVHEFAEKYPVLCRKLS